MALPKTDGQRLKYRLLLHDALLITIMGTLAACGLIYEYLMAHYAGRILGAMESTLYAMIGVMIVSMGVGALFAKFIRCPFNGFVWLEWAIGLAGATSIVLLSVSFSLVYTLPTFLQDIYGLHTTITTDGEFIRGLSQFTRILPFLAGGMLGLMIGMEIPLVARIREHLHQERLTHNIGTIYGADYIGAGVGAAVWVLVCLKLPIITAAIFTALVNAVVGVIFVIVYRKQLKSLYAIVIAHCVLLAVIVSLSLGGADFMGSMQSSLFKDNIIYTKITPYQHLTVTERNIGKGMPVITSLYINGRLQFASNDETIYHSYLTYPALLASARQDHILVIGGGDGLALRDILEWEPESVTLIDLDSAMIEMFQGVDTDAPPAVSKRLTQLNNNAFNDSRVEVVIGDAFVEVEKLVTQRRFFDTIIVDLPDPSHPDLAKVYSAFFYARLNALLSGDGVLAVQSTSPFHTREAFISIGKTLAHSGFANVDQYHTNVPTFGEWGWSIATKHGRSAKQRITESTRLSPSISSRLSKAQMLAAFVFTPGFYADSEQISINILGTHTLYQYHQKAWRENEGVFFAKRAIPVASVP